MSAARGEQDDRAAGEGTSTPPWKTGDVELPDAVYDALVPLDGFPEGTRGGPRIYSYEDRWWVCVSLSDFGDLLVGAWGDLAPKREGM